MTELNAYIHIIVKRLWLIALLVIVAVVGVYVIESRRPPKYQATVRLQILTIEPENVTLFTPVRQIPSAQQISRTVNEFISVLRNRQVAWDAAREINKELGTHLTADDIIKVMWPRAVGDFLTVTYVSADTATLAKHMADVHIAKALEYYRTTRTRSVTEARLFIEKQVRQQEEALSLARSHLRDFQLRYDISDIHREALAVQDQVRTLQMARDNAQVGVDKAQAMAAVYRKQAQELRKQAERLATSDSQRANSLRAQAATFEAKAVTEEANAGAGQAAISRYDDLIATYKNHLAELIGLEGEYNRLVKEVARAEDRYTFLSDKLNEAQIKEALALNNGYIQVVEAAREPVEPVAKPFSRLVLFAAGLALMLGIVLAFVLEFVERLLARRRAIPAGATQESL